MFYAELLVFVSVALTVLGVSALGLSQGDIPALALAIPALWLLPQGGAAAWLLLIGLASFALVLPEQPLALSVSLWMMMPILVIVFSKKSSWQLGALLLFVVLAMDSGLMALQSEGKLPGSTGSTLIQLLAVTMIWFAARSWRPVEGNTWWPLFLVIPLWVGGWEHAALAALSITGIIAALQGMVKLKHTDWIPRMAWILPAVGFATLVLVPYFEVPSPVLVAWLLVLCTAWLGEYLMNEPEEEEM